MLDMCNPFLELWWYVERAYINVQKISDLILNCNKN